jgi:AraC family transcriptional activator of pobA
MNKMPVYAIEDFNVHKEHETEFYVNRLRDHIKTHVFTRLPHKHDFYLVMLITSGSGWHEIDFKRYRVKPGRIFLMQPGQMHYWKLSNDTDGYVFFHTRSFYDEAYTLNSVHDFPFFKSFYSNPCMQLKNSEEPLQLMEEMMKEHRMTLPYKMQRLHSLINLVYTGLTRMYATDERTGNRRYFEHFRKFERLLEKNFRENKLPGFYAEKMNMTEKHLNRIVRECTGKTSTAFIAERVILEAKRLLMHSMHNVSEAGYELGFSDNSYFVRFFKAHTGSTPLTFLKEYKA